ncbi:MAG: SBBP repeat-containing protein [Bacteroidales bacterium]
MKSLKTILMSLLCLMAVFMLLHQVLLESVDSGPGTLYQHQLNVKESGRAEYTGFNKLLHFEPNLGQTNGPAHFISRGRGYNLSLSSSGAAISMRNQVNSGSNQEDAGLARDPSTLPEASYYTIYLQFEGSNPDPVSSGAGELPGKTNYFTGNDPANWITNIPTYARVEYKDVYTGIDLVYYGNEGELEYDFIVAPGGNPQDILLKFGNHDKLKIDEKGSLVIDVMGKELTMKAPFSYQDRDGTRNPVFSEYVLVSENTAGFNVGDYNPLVPLVIDPVLVYSSYLGGSGFENVQSIAVDSEGCVYVTGSTSSADFPTLSCFQCDKAPGTSANLTDVFVTKFNPEGTGLVYSTYIGGRWDDGGSSIAVDENGRVYLTGRTFSRDDPDTEENEGFPLMNAYQEKIAPNFSNAFVTVLNATGNELIYSSYLGGKYEDYGTGIAVDENGCVYVTGTQFSFDFPVKNAFMDDKPGYYFDAFVSKLDPYRSGEESLIYSTHLGGIGDDYGNSIAVDREGCAWVTGKAFSSDFPVTTNAIQAEKRGKNDVFVTKFAADGRSLEYSTYLGSVENDEGYDIQVDTAGYAYISGVGRDGFPTSQNTFMPSGGYFFLCKLLPDGSDFVFSTHTPVSGNIAVDDLGQAYIGATRLQSVAYIVAMNSEGSDTLFTLSLAGDGTNFIRDIAVDHERNLYISGTTSSTDITTEGAYKTSLSGERDIFVAKFGRPEDVLIVKVLQGNEYSNWTIPNAVFDIYSIDLANKDNPLNFLETQATDKKGLLYLPADYYYPGMPFLVRHTHWGMKDGSKEDSRYLFRPHVDNLIIDNDGNVKTQYIESEPEDTTFAYLWHTSMEFNLVVSVQWKASMDYINKLEAAFRKASNLMYDVTNGQAYIGWVTIHDDGQNWESADILIYASNIQWPAADVGGIYESDKFIFLPPAFYVKDNSQQSVQVFYDTDPVDPSNLLFVTSLVHELGHYAFGFHDEYQNHRGRRIHRNINFGFMDNPDDLEGDPMSSEMSDYRPGDANFERYSETEQYYRIQKSCWSHFAESFSFLSDDNNLHALILTPLQRGITSDKVMKGPNSDLENPDFSVGSMMVFENKATTTTNPSRICRLTTLVGGTPVITKVNLEKIDTKRWIEHGKTTQTGHIKLFNPEVGDKIFASSRSSGQWMYVTKIVADNPSKKSADNAEIIEMKAVSGRFNLISGITFNAFGDPVYQCRPEPAFSSSPSVRVLNDSSVPEEQVLTEVAGTWSVTLSDHELTDGNIFFTAPDSLGETFFVPQGAAIRDVADLGEYYYFEGMQLKFAIDQSETTAEKIALLASDFPAPDNGLPGSVLRVSDVVSLQAFPEGSEIVAQIQLRYSTGSLEALGTDALTVYKWEDGWIPLESHVDLVYSTISAIADGPGYFAAFLDLTQSTLITGSNNYKLPEVPSGLVLHPSYPNPFSSSTSISFELPVNAKVSLDILDIYGRKINTLVNQSIPAGEYTVVWDCLDARGNHIPPGIYICVLNYGTVKISQPMMLIR